MRPGAWTLLVTSSNSSASRIRHMPGNWQPNSINSIRIARKKSGESCVPWKSASPPIPALCDAYCIVIDGEGWHRGVIGITATRIVERYNRPTLVISRDGEEAFGSGRSIRAFHLLEAVESCGTFSRATAATPMPADSPCRPRMSPSCAPVSISLPEPSSNPRGFRSDARCGWGT